jgi:hypothetical protein
MKYIIKYSMIIGVLAFLIIIPRELVFQDGVSLCVFKRLTHINCPLCGMTRASFEILHVNFPAAVNLNPISIFLPIILLVEILFDYYHLRFIIIVRRVIYILFFAGLLVLFGIRIFQYFSA